MWQTPQPEVAPTMVSEHALQEFLADAGHYRGAIDGIIGPKTKRAMADLLRPVMRAREENHGDVARWSERRLEVGTLQLFLKSKGQDPGAVDGYHGDLTDEALRAYKRAQRGEPPETWRDYQTPRAALRWPSRHQLDDFYGTPGLAVKGQLVTVDVPFPLVIAWNTSQTVERVTLHRKCADSYVRILRAVLDAYGLDEIKRLGINLYGGAYNHRRVRGGTSWSCHAYGCAVDHDPARNRLRWGRPRAAFSQPEYDKLHECFEAEGWVNLGREKNYDWMHFQAARL